MRVAIEIKKNGNQHLILASWHVFREEVRERFNYCLTVIKCLTRIF